MSQQLINAYLKELATLRRIGGTTEGVTSEAFKDLLKAWARPLGFTFIPQHAFTTTARVNNRVDGAIMLERFPIGYWEAKDEDDDLNVEIEKKFRRGYPKTNIIFEDTHRAVLWQHGKFVMDCAVTDGPELGKLLDIFFGYEREETTNFRKAVAQFKVDLPPVLDILRVQIDAAQASVPAFQSAAAAFLKQAKETINPSVTAEDVREMLIQHILTENIFAKVFGDDEFHRKNNVAAALYALEDTFFSGDVRRRTLSKLSTYYSAIESAAALIASHSEKQGFLKAIYEGFYKVYNAKAADRLGVVYTPNEIVRFMVESADWLCEKHFKKNLIDRDVEILDPATGTGTFIVELLEHFSGQPEKLKHKYAEELHANEVAILPYYVANLNIEATYAALTGDYNEFQNLCFVDTLDNTAALVSAKGVTGDLFGAVSAENVERIRRQNTRRISVVIGNPPYNANQTNENDNNKNREYRELDSRIKNTYVKLSSSHKTKMYDMYIRFFRWAADRIGDDGIVCFITNRSFIDARNADGFRKAVSDDFNEIVIVDLGGDYKKKGSAGGGNVFGIGTGVAISFWIKSAKLAGKTTQIRTIFAPEGSGQDKLSWLDNADIATLSFDAVSPDEDGNWTDKLPNEFGDTLQLLKPKLSAKGRSDANSIFELSSFGVVSQRDDWVYDRSHDQLVKKIDFYVGTYDEVRSNLARPLPENWESGIDYKIKWPQDLRRKLKNDDQIDADVRLITPSAYRPYSRREFYYSPSLNWSLCQMPSMFPTGSKNRAICFTDPTSQKPWLACAVDTIADLHFVGSGAGAMCISRYRYVGTDRLDNITDWALKQFTDRYGKAAAISKDDIFAYVYAVLHDPVYRETYALNLKREFPRIPLYPDFKRWRDWGQALLDLHIGYETAAPAALTRTDTPDPKRAPDTTPVVKLKSDPDNGIIMLDADTQLSGVPLSAWRYRLGNRSAIDWVLDQHKEKTPKDPTIREKFNTYRFADYKERVVELLARVVTVSVQTVAITDAMAELPASAREQKKADA